MLKLCSEEAWAVGPRRRRPCLNIPPPPKKRAAFGHRASWHLISYAGLLGPGSMWVYVIMVDALSDDYGRKLMAYITQPMYDRVDCSWWSSHIAGVAGPGSRRKRQFGPPQQNVLFPWPPASRFRLTRIKTLERADQERETGKGECKQDRRWPAGGGKATGAEVLVLA